MKKLITLLIISLFLCSPVYAGMVLYENVEKGISIGFDDLTPTVLYDLKNKEVLAGVSTSLVEYKRVNFDIGVIGPWDELDENIDFFVGLSTDVNAFEFKENVYATVGVFASPGWIDDGPFRYGFQGRLTIEF